MVVAGRDNAICRSNACANLAARSVHHNEALTTNVQSEPDFTEASEPYQLFVSWLREAEKSEPNDPNAMALSTVDDEGMPDVRMVLLKGFDERGFVFYTNFGQPRASRSSQAERRRCCSTGRVSGVRCVFAAR